MTGKIVIAGIPNCGKTTLWNFLTGNFSKTGNWPGVTSLKLSAPLLSFPRIELIDLPGTYSLSGKNPEELSAVNYLRNIDADSMIILIDGTKPEPGIYFALELLSLGIPSVIGINFCDKAKRKNIVIDCAALSAKLNVPVFCISTIKKQGIDALLNAVIDISGEKTFERRFLTETERRLLAEKLSSECFLSNKIFSPEKFTTWLLIIIYIFSAFFISSVIKNSFENIFFSLSGSFKNIIASGYPDSVFFRLFSEGVLPGIFSAIIFIPDIAFAFFILSLFEESGLLARTAFLSDFFLKKVGLSGKSMFPLLTGFGCTVPAVYAAKYSGSVKEANRTLSALMFVPCYAKLPLSLLVCEKVFPGFGKSAVIFFFLVSIISGWIFLLFCGKERCSDFVLEIPELYVPPVKVLFRFSGKRLLSFIKKSAIIILITSVLIKLSACSKLINIPVEFIYPLFVPLKIPFEGVAALFGGLFSKEAALFILMSISDNVSSVFDKTSAISFLLFYFTYSPCLAALSSIKNEFGIKTALWLFIRQNIFAFLLSFSFCQLSAFIINIFIR